MQTLGPYYSHTLLNAVLSHSIRWGKGDPETKRLLDESYDGGAIFGEHARSMLFGELSSGICNVPTVQTLLLLSAQECNFGNTTQAWSYSGLAFRLIDHLGICLDVERYPGSVPLNDEDVEIRHRLFWSCYFWDKMISLYLGRPPSLQHTMVSPPQVMFDDSGENEMWVPFGTAQEGTPWKYPPTAAHSTSCFMAMCRLSVIFNEILIHMYDPLGQNTESEMRMCLHGQEAALQQWWDDLPPYLRIDPVTLPSLSPPSHIVTMNCLYLTFRILLFRPMLSRGAHSEAEGSRPAHHYLVECVASATATIAIFDLFRRTFGMDYCVLSQSYSVYIAASVFLLQVQASPNDQQAMRRLNYCIQVLDHVKNFSPIIGTALSHILRELAAIGLSPGAPPIHDPGPPTQPPPTTTAESPLAQGLYASSPMMPPQQPPQQQRHMPADHLVQTPWTTFQPESIPQHPSIYEAMSSIQPLSIGVGTLHELNSQKAQGAQV
jgi:hypothetical protein